MAKSVLITRSQSALLEAVKLLIFQKKAVQITGSPPWLQRLAASQLRSEPRVEAEGSAPNKQPSKASLIWLRRLGGVG